MSRKTHTSLTGWVLALLVLAFSGVMAVSAAPPSNDDITSATTVAEPLPFSDSTSTLEATTAADDPDCFGNGPTVWYIYTPTLDVTIQADTLGSDYDTTLSAYTGLPGSLNQIACNDDAGSLQSRVSFDAVAGETYYFMVGAYASGAGGNLEFHVDELVPFSAEFQVASSGSFNKAGSATIRGTVTCSRPAFVYLNAAVQQKVGRVVITGSSDTFFPCDGETAWEIVVPGQNGRFAGGAATVSVYGYAYDAFDFIEYSQSLSVQLRKK